MNFVPFLHSPEKQTEKLITGKSPSGGTYHFNLSECFHVRSLKKYIIHHMKERSDMRVGGKWKAKEENIIRKKNIQMLHTFFSHHHL